MSSVHRHSAPVQGQPSRPYLQPDADEIGFTLPADAEREVIDWLGERDDAETEADIAAACNEELRRIRRRRPAV
jgi:hypothetical protein